MFHNTFTNYDISYHFSTISCQKDYSKTIGWLVQIILLERTFSIVKIYHQFLLLHFGYQCLRLSISCLTLRNRTTISITMKIWLSLLLADALAYLSLWFSLRGSFGYSIPYVDVNFQRNLWRKFNYGFHLPTLQNTLPLQK